MKNLIYFILLVIATIGLWYVDPLIPSIQLSNYFLVSLYSLIVYVVFQLFTNLLLRRLKDENSKYSFRKALNILQFVIISFIIITVFASDITSLTIAYGLLGAGIAFALQDFFKNFVGGIFLYTSRIYKVGDRIELNAYFGDVIDIGIFYTTLMEIKNWVSGDQATGRLTMIPNSFVISNTLSNYTKEHSFLWDEISIPLTYDSNWRKAKEKMLKVVDDKTQEFILKAEKELTKIKEKYFIKKKNFQPQAFVLFNDNWISISIRYVTLVSDRRTVKSIISEAILSDVIEKNKDIRTASTTSEVTLGKDSVIRVNK